MSNKVIEFHVRSADGTVVRYGTCSEDTLSKQANAGESVHTGLPARIPADPPMFGDNYIAKRFQAYPSVSDQLDILYHEGFEAWKQAIAAVKTKYPKV